MTTAHVSMFSRYNMRASSKCEKFIWQNKCPYCGEYHTTIDWRPQPAHIQFWPEACPECKHNRSKSEQGDGYAPYGSKQKRRKANA